MRLAVPFCTKEPRVKGSFKGLALIYGDVRVRMSALSECASSLSS